MPTPTFPAPRVATVLAALACLAVTAVPARAQSARTYYERAQAREETAHKAATPSAASLRTAARAYEQVVLRYPTNGYCDDALWNAAALMREAFVASGSAADRQAAEKYLTWLKKEYPHSKLVAQVPDALAALEDAAKPARPAPAATPADPDPPAGVAVVRSISTTPLPQGDRITIEFSREVAFEGDRLEGPDRVFFDFSDSTPVTNLAERAGALEGQLVKALRVGRHQNHVTRVVLELDGQPRYSAFPLYDPFRLVIDVESDSLPLNPRATASPRPAAATSGPAARPAAPEGAGQSSAVPPPFPVGAATKPEGASAPVTAEPESPSGPPPPPPAPAESTAKGDYTLARQLGLSVSRIVIDAGHGGHDPGAQANGITEAQLVLDIAQRTKKLLESHPGIEVVLTRDDNRYIPLEERTAIANREGADLFLSIHANASRQAATHGIETYLLNFATNPEAEAVAARENATSAQAMGTLPSILKAIMMNNKLKESRELATMVQTSLVRGLRPRNSAVRDLGVKQAPFVVLIGAEMPSVLAEISFLTNRTEASLLKQSAYRDRIAESLADAVLKYQASLKRVTTVASRDESR
ncbi:MAG: N-acetylmuramoyl-L-alanine amidase [Vicinamibacterales bacterium]